jgi:hypothetical protein
MDEQNHHTHVLPWRGRRRFYAMPHRGTRARRYYEEYAPEALFRMIRIIGENILLFLLPTIVYVAYVYLTREEKQGAARVLDDAPLIWLFVAGAVLVTVTLVTFAFLSGGKPGQGLHAARDEGRAHRAGPPRLAAGSTMTRADDAGPLPSLADAEWLNKPQARAVFAALRAAGAAARAVGGAVRNALMGVPVKDLDIATTAVPAEVVRLAQQAGLHAVPTGIDHGTVTVVADHVPFEVTTLRKDIETFGRHAHVTFTTDWREDALRRDFTINALYCGSDGKIRDPLRSTRHVLARRVQFIGDAHQRIRGLPAHSALFPLSCHVRPPRSARHRRPRGEHRRESRPVAAFG